MAFGQYTNLDFDQIKTSIKDYLKSNDNFTDYDFEGSNLSIILDALAYNTYITAYNTNMAVNENFLDSATLRENVVALARNIGYVPRSRKASKAKISFNIQGLDSAVTVTLKAGLVVNGVAENTSYIFSIPEDITVAVKNNIAFFDEIEVFEGLLLTQNFTVDISKSNQRFILPNSFIDTDSIRVNVKSSETSSTKVAYTPVDNIIGITSTSNTYLLQEIEDERYEIMFGDGIIGRKLVNNNYVTISYLQTQGKSANGAAEFSFIGRLIDQDGASVGGTNVSLVETLERSRDGDDIESIASIKYYSPRIYSSQYRAVTSSDYEAVLSYIYPNVESVTSYGGEELVPPRYGKVYLSVKPRNGDYLSDFTKRDLISKLKNYAVAGIVPEFIDLKYLFVETESQVYYNPNHNQQPALLKSAISGALTEYSKSIDVNKFGGRFKYSRTVTLIDQVDNAITSNITKVTIRRNLRVEIAQWAQYELCYGNEFHVGESSYNVTSTGFTLDGVSGTVYLADEVIDDKKGRIFFFTYSEGGKPNIIKKNAGTVKYDIGEILIDTVNITSTAIENDVIEIQAVPQSNDVIGLRDLYIKYDMTNTELTVVQDIIASGENTSGSRFARGSSYNIPTYTRDSKSEVSTKTVASTASSTKTRSSSFPTTSSTTTYST